MVGSCPGLMENVHVTESHHGAALLALRLAVDVSGTANLVKFRRITRCLEIKSAPGANLSFDADSDFAASLIHLSHCGK